MGVLKEIKKETMHRFAALMAVIAVAAGRDCNTSCSDPKIQDWDDQDSRSCDCKCKFDGPEGFTDHKGGKSAPCDEALNDKDSGACTCTPKTCDNTAASCIPEGEMDPMPVEADFKISSFADGCKCMPATEPADMCAEKKYMG